MFKKFLILNLILSSHILMGMVDVDEKHKSAEQEAKSAKQKYFAKLSRPLNRARQTRQFEGLPSVSDDSDQQSPYRSLYNLDGLHIFNKEQKNQQKQCSPLDITKLDRNSKDLVCHYLQGFKLKHEVNSDLVLHFAISNCGRYLTTLSLNSKCDLVKAFLDLNLNNLVNKNLKGIPPSDEEHDKIKIFHTKWDDIKNRSIIDHMKFIRHNFFLKIFDLENGNTLVNNTLFHNRLDFCITILGLAKYFPSNLKQKFNIFEKFENLLPSKSLIMDNIHKISKITPLKLISQDEALQIDENLVNKLGQGEDKLYIQIFLLGVSNYSNLMSSKINVNNFNIKNILSDLKNDFSTLVTLDSRNITCHSLSPNNKYFAYCKGQDKWYENKELIAELGDDTFEEFIQKACIAWDNLIDADDLIDSSPLLKNNKDKKILDYLKSNIPDIESGAELCVVDIGNNEVIKKIQLPCNATDIQINNKCLIAALDDGRYLTLDLNLNSIPNYYNGLDKTYCLNLSDNNKYLISHNNCEYSTIWDTNSGALVHEQKMAGLLDGLIGNRISTSNNGKYIACASENGIIKVFENQGVLTDISKKEKLDIDNTFIDMQNDYIASQNDFKNKISFARSVFALMKVLFFAYLANKVVLYSLR